MLEFVTDRLNAALVGWGQTPVEGTHVALDEQGRECSQSVFGTVRGRDIVRGTVSVEMRGGVILELSGNEVHDIADPHP